MENYDDTVWANTPCETFRYCELVANDKKPIHNGWQRNTKSFDEVWAAYEAKKSNIGLVLGDTSNVMDIDCDSREAVVEQPH